MMKRFACGDVVPNCTASWTAPTEDEILTKVAEHAATAHGLVEIPPELVAAVRSKIASLA